MRKVVINRSFGGFFLSDEAFNWLKERGVDCYWIERDNPLLVECVETLGEKANGTHAKLKVVEIPSDIQWQIEECDGVEWVAEVHSTWC